MMRITYCESYQEMSIRAADRVMDRLTYYPGLLLCASTGHSPSGLYQEIGKQYQTKPHSFEQMRVIKLDEWGGLPHDHPVTCEQYLRHKLLEPLAISEERYFTFRSDATDPEVECRKVRTFLAQEGPIDVCILGLGKNGHLGLNEPAQKLEAHCHWTPLSTASMTHPMIASLDRKPRFGMTLGMQDILSSKKIVLLATGEGKQAVASKLLEQKTTPSLPASLLWTHPDTECFWDRSAID